jgi:hypothetical protein
MTVAISHGSAPRPNASRLSSSASRSALITLVRNGCVASLGATALTLIHVPDTRRRAAAGVLLMEDDLPGERSLLAAVPPRPAKASPAGRSKMRVPGQALLEVLMLTARAAKAAQRGEFARHVDFKPGADATAELLVLGGQLNCRLPAAGWLLGRSGALLRRAWPASHVTSRLAIPSTCLPKESRAAHHSGGAGVRSGPAW